VATTETKEQQTETTSSLEITRSAETTGSAVDDASRPFVGQWHTLLSTTNWEKGQILSDWRAAKEKSGEEVSAYSDEAWAQLVGEVTSQHVGRLRRVFDRFGSVQSEYEGLYWSHFHAALDWDDPEIWLEGALHQGWSISRMRRQREMAHGEAEEAGGENVTQSRITGEEVATVTDPGMAASAAGAADRPTDASAEDASDAPFDDQSNPEMTAAEKSTPAKHRPFEELAELPDDLADAFESMKLAILHHKLTSWEAVSREDLLSALDALKQLAVAPSE